MTIFALYLSSLLTIYPFFIQHDAEGNPQCSPGGSNGNYIMYPRATDGTQRNNDRFSPCSINSIYSVLRTKSRCFRSKNCVISILLIYLSTTLSLFHLFLTPFHPSSFLSLPIPLLLLGDGSFCGNQLIEDGERCDCGSNDQGACDLIDSCCNATTCQLKSSASCR